ncbi:MAG: DUF4240 domain-containing protein [Armatimonas sp.]
MDTENDFWALIEASRATTQEEQESRLEKLLAGLAPQDLPRFQAFLDKYRGEAYRWDLWGAAYVIQGGCSDDSFLYFRYWLIAQGRKIYEAALAHPDSLIEILSTEDDDPCLEFEELGGLAISAWEGKSLFPWENAYEWQPSSVQPAGAPWEEEDLPLLVPRLWARFDAEL